MIDASYTVNVRPEGSDYLAWGFPLRSYSPRTAGSPTYQVFNCAARALTSCVGPPPWPGRALTHSIIVRQYGSRPPLDVILLVGRYGSCIINLDSRRCLSGPTELPQKGFLTAMSLEALAKPFSPMSSTTKLPTYHYHRHTSAKSKRVNSLRNKGGQKEMFHSHLPGFISSNFIATGQDISP